MRFIIEKDSAQRILDFLQTQPYREVFDLIPLLIEAGPRNPGGLKKAPEDDAKVPDFLPDEEKAE